MQFEKWLKTQNHRDDIIGDLAKDYIKAREIGRKPYVQYCDNSAHYNIEEQMKAWDASYLAYESLEEARAEYAALFPKVK